MQTIISGIQPTGNLHLGNYLGTLAKWSDFQEEYKCFFPIVDLHAITAGFINKGDFKNNIYKSLATYLSTGLNPNKSVIFQQSNIAEHSELFWILSNIAQMGKLNRMTQFKSKSPKNQQHAVLGLYAYPVLMAADIILYNADLVPVGEDQIQHIELTNDIIDSFNHHYQDNILKNPQPLLQKNCKRIMSLKNGSNKMSKSAESDMSRINLSDSKELISKKILKAKTDQYDNLDQDLDKRPEIQNLLNIFTSLTQKSESDIQNDYRIKGFQKFKQDLAEIIIQHITPIGQAIDEYYDDKSYLDSILENGKSKAGEYAERNLNNIKNIIGMI
jgi:tryptophanyl-tRNA synthetase